MARYILIAAVVGTPPRSSPTKFPRGTTIASDDASALPGDVVYPALCQNPTPQNMAPLDAAGSARMGGAKIMTLADVATSSAGGACGENL
jgi:hypothetical protein